MIAPGTPGSAPGPDGFERRPVYALDRAHLGETRIAPRSVSAWHHHAQRTLLGFVVEGTVTFEFGPAGEERTRVAVGEFFRIPPGLVHRDVNDSPVAVRIISVSVGEGPATVDVVGPVD